MLIASTGVIGEPLPATKFASVMGDLVRNARADIWIDAAKAIMTTDTFPKVATATAKLGSATVIINGIAKGAGMIAPDMATMLSFVFTDAPLAPSALQGLLKTGVDDTFNAVTIDGDTSTSDTLLAFATGMAAARGAPRIARAGDPRLRAFAKAFHSVLANLAEQVARDGEGARKLVEIIVEGAVSTSSARKIARSIANSPLVKTAIAGEDANWGRVVMAVGKAGEPADRDKLSIWFGDIRVAHRGARDPAYDEASGLRGDEAAGDQPEGGARTGQRSRPDAHLRSDQGIRRDQWRLSIVTGSGERKQPVPVVLVAACALVDADGRVLIAQRPAGRAMAGLWEFPGGKIEPGERPEETLIRELKEELGVTVTEPCLAPLTFASHGYSDFHLLMPLFVCRRWEGTPSALEGQTLKWVRPNQLRDFPMPPADLPLISHLMTLL